MALLGDFSGYYPRLFARLFAERRNSLTWVVLKAHTENRGGTVALALRRSARSAGHQLQLLRAKAATPTSTTRIGRRRHPLRAADDRRPLQQRGLIAEEELPGDASSRRPRSWSDFVRDNAWGHHASCTCAMGRATRAACSTATSACTARRGLRVVDASVFPRIPGFFIVSAIYMIGEKAADVILADASCGYP